jgi:RNA polymerase sigma-70 factor (ECF subfamily)
MDSESFVARQAPGRIPEWEMDAGRKQLEREYEQLWRDHGASLTRLASSYELNAHAREDLLQEIRLAIWVALPRFRGESSLRTFLFRIAHNRALTHVWRRKRSISSEDSAETVDKRLGPEAAAIRAVNCSHLTEAIRQLPLPFRQVITLSLEDLSHTEIASVLGINENNVAVRMNRARKLLREKLEESQ